MSTHSNPIIGKADSSILAQFAFALDPAISAEFLEEKSAAIEQQATKEDQPDLLIVYHPHEESEMQISSTLIRTTFFPSPGTPNTVQCIIGNEIFTFDPGGKKATWAPGIQERNRRLGYETPVELLRDTDTKAKKPAPQKVLTATEFPFHTSQEMYALSCAQADGATFEHYEIHDQEGAIIHQRRKTHFIKVGLTEEERASGLDLDYLENLIRNQDADAIIATAYILGVLAPPPHLPPRPYAGGWIDLDNVIKKVGWRVRNARHRGELRAKVWSFIRFNELAQINGQRTGTYKDAEGNVINTQIQASPWRIMKTEKPDQSSLYPALEVPLRVEIVVSREITALISHPKVAQYFRCGEIPGTIPGGKPAGAWARVVGLALMDFWRRNAREYDSGTRRPSRRELLDYLAAKLAPYREVLDGNDPARAIDYWCGALQLLADAEFIDRTGEAAITARAMRKELREQRREGWQDPWLNETVEINPGRKTRPVFDEVLKMRPARKRRDLKAKPRRRRKSKTD